jgi:hypothetical protein
MAFVKVATSWFLSVAPLKLAMIDPGGAMKTVVAS